MVVAGRCAACRPIPRSGSIALVALVVVAAQRAFAQIPNAGFENWSAGDPTDWLTNNAPGYASISQSGAAHSGSSVLRGMSSALSEESASCRYAQAAQMAEDSQSVPARMHFTGFYTLADKEGDYLSVQVAFTRGGDVIGSDVAALTGTSVYTEFVANIGWLTADVPDTAITEFLVLNTGGPFIRGGTIYTIDDLSWGTATAVEKVGVVVPSGFSLGQNYPSPLNPTTVVSYQLPVASDVRLAVFDFLGREVALLANERKDAGVHTVTFNGSDLASGVYLYRLQAGEFTQTKRLVLTK